MLINSRGATVVKAVVGRGLILHYIDKNCSYNSPQLILPELG